MKIMLVSVGTRGDMEPFLAIGEILKKHGHEITCLFPYQFENLVANSGFKFHSLGSKFIELLQTAEGKKAMSGGKFGFKKLKAYAKLISKQGAANKEITQNQEKYIEQENPDLILHHTKAIYPILWETKNKNKTVVISPVPYLNYVKGHSHLVFNSNFGNIINKLTYKLVNSGIIYNTFFTQKYLKIQKQRISKKTIKNILKNQKTIYSISPSIFPQPSYWNDNVKVLGFHERVKTNNWQPETALHNFIEKHSKILFITFGSMVNELPVKNTRTLIEIVTKNKIPTIINTHSGGLVKPKDHNLTSIYFTKSIPYEWIFPKVYAVIHHGGSGTTQTALKYGCANLIIPHILDQYVWNKIIYQKKAGPIGIDISKISMQNLEPKILDLWNNAIYKKHAKKLSTQIQNEDYEAEIIDFIFKKI